MVYICKLFLDGGRAQWRQRWGERNEQERKEPKVGAEGRESERKSLREKGSASKWERVCVWKKNRNSH